MGKKTISLGRKDRPLAKMNSSSFNAQNIASKVATSCKRKYGAIKTTNITKTFSKAPAPAQPLSHLRTTLGGRKVRKIEIKMNNKD